MVAAQAAGAMAVQASLAHRVPLIAVAVAVAAAPVEMAHPALPNRWPGPAVRV
jgi:hypothetical protein